MNWARNLLICVGAFWLSRQCVVPLSLVLDRVGSGVGFGQSFLSAIAFGITWSLGRSAAAALGGAIATMAVVSAKPQRWSVVVALMYVLFAAPRGHYVRPPTSWDKVSDVSNVVWPAVVRVGVAMLVARVKRPTDRNNLENSGVKTNNSVGSV